jgi:hypothetical protein
LGGGKTGQICCEGASPLTRFPRAWCASAPGLNVAGFARALLRSPFGLAAIFWALKARPTPLEIEGIPKLLWESVAGGRNPH